MNKFEMTRSFDDGEIYSSGNDHYLFVWGYSTGSDTGQHNEYNTNTQLLKWAGDPCNPADLPSLKESDEWQSEDGFDIKIIENEYDWEDYSKKVEEYLSEKSIISQAAVALGRKGGSVKSEAKIAASRENGKLGGRPKKVREV